MAESTIVAGIPGAPEIQWRECSNVARRSSAKRLSFANFSVAERHGRISQVIQDSVNAVGIGGIAIGLVPMWLNRGRAQAA
jgi:hypothetical protein